MTGRSYDVWSGSSVIVDKERGCAIYETFDVDMRIRLDLYEVVPILEYLGWLNVRPKDPLGQRVHDRFRGKSLELP